MSSIRAFIAIDLPAPIRRGLGEQIHDLREAMPGVPVRWVRPEAIHLTLRFLGDTERDQLRALEQGLERLGRGNAVFSIDVGGIGSFPSVRLPRVLWVGVQEETGALKRLQQETEAFCRSLGYAAERRAFSPHLTLGRVRRGGEAETGTELARYLAMDQAPRLGSFAVGEVILFQSELRPDGAVYRRLASVGLESNR